ncbi:oxidoreductase [Marinicrinis sediminis]|uniref:Oxidoreductase n=1 Tax=Marinicrinis sediminis TaxID=1652465 RepID=A0ABW5R745_9BACL
MNATHRHGKQVILITGASSGIGKASALKLLEEGHIVYAAARRLEQMEDLKRSGARILSLDISQEADIVQCVHTVIEEQGRIDVLFNNAGFGLYGSVEDIPLEEARYQFDVNLFGLARITQLVLPHMRKQNSGKIINTSSMGGKMYTPLGAWYHATKHALEGWSDCLRLEVQSFGIDVVIIEPGLILTEFGDVVSKPMKRHSGNGAYRSLAQAVSKASESAYTSGGGSSPDVIANVVARAVRSPRPKTRYAAGKWAKPMMTMRKWLGDKVFDRIIMSQVK